MISSIVDGIVAAILDKFPTGYEVYTESIEQGLTEPCFFVQCIDPREVRQHTYRKKRTYLFMIQYFPSSEDCYDEIYGVIEKLNECLELITLDSDLIRGTDASASITDGVLNYQINYTVFVVDPDREENMQDVDISNTIRSE